MHHVMTEDVWIPIFRHLDLPSIARIALTSKKWSNDAWEYMENLVLSEDKYIAKLLTDNSHMACKFRNMRKLCFIGTKSFSLTDELLSLTTLRFSRLTHLYLWNIKDLTDSGLRDALQESPQLQWLELINCANITGVIQLSKSATMYTFDCFKGHTFIICQCPSITVFSCDPENLQSLSLINQPAVDRAMFRSTLAKIHQLRKLEITGSPQIDSYALEPVSIMENLETLLLSGCNVTEAFINDLTPTKLPALKHLEISNNLSALPDNALDEIGRRFAGRLQLVLSRTLPTAPEFISMMICLNRLPAALAIAQQRKHDV